MLLKHERQAYKVFFKALEETNLAIGYSCMSKLGEEPTKSGWRTGAVTVTDLSHWFQAEIEVLEERARL